MSEAVYRVTTHSHNYRTGDVIWINREHSPLWVEIDSIKKELYQSSVDKYPHYVGRDKEGNVLFRINCLVPCEVIYTRADEG